MCRPIWEFDQQPRFDHGNVHKFGVKGRTLLILYIMPLYSKGEPNDSGGNEDCVMMYTDDGYWNDLNCDNTLQFICEKKSK